MIELKGMFTSNNEIKPIFDLNGSYINYVIADLL